MLTYHRVDWPDASPYLNPRSISATPTEFCRQTDFLAEKRCVVGMDEVIAAATTGGALPPGAVLISFDDAYRDFAVHAWPALRERSLPVTLFVATAYPDQPHRAFWWDRIYHAISMTGSSSIEVRGLGVVSLANERARADSLRRIAAHLKSAPHHEAMSAVDALCQENGAAAGGAVLDWDELRRLANEGVTLAPHTRTHPLLNRISEAEAREEVLGSRSDLEREIGAAPPVFAYPAGAHDGAVVRLVSELGFRLAFTTRRGANRFPPRDPFRLRRINVGRSTPLALLRAQLLL
ncbi:MAG: polysaccharide deacetylase family protein [Planctomycetes bacterium]|nr:polysaccharide deacetylase family protein [Planctomycetota bacterium]